MKVTCQDFLYMVIFIKLRLVNRIFELANARDVNLWNKNYAFGAYWSDLDFKLVSDSSR